MTVVSQMLADFYNIIPQLFIVLYADGILLLASSISELQLLFQACEHEFTWLNMCINVV